MFTGQRPTPGPGEPAWTERDMQLALEWQALQDITCSGCGQPMDESMLDDAADMYEADPVKCHACEAIGNAGEQADKAKADGHPINLHGRRYEVHRRG